MVLIDEYRSYKLVLSKEFMILYLSIHFLLFCTAVFINLARASTIFLFTLPPSLFIALLIKHIYDNKKYVTPRIKIPTRDRRIEPFVYAILILSSLGILLARVFLLGESGYSDEPVHLELTRIAYSSGLDQMSELIQPGHMPSIARGYNLFGNPNPFFRYMILSLILSPFGASLFTGRVVLSTFSSFVPLLVYFLAKELNFDLKTSFALGFTYIFVPLYQSTANLYLFDGMSTLWFLLSLIFFIRSIRSEKKRYYVLAGFFWILCALTIYPPALWLFLGFLASAIYLRNVSRRYTLAFLSASLLFFILLNANVLAPQTKIILDATTKWPHLWSTSYTEMISLFWNLNILFGWAPIIIMCLIILEIFKKILRGRADWLSALCLTLFCGFFLTLLFFPQSRRLVQIFPLAYLLIMNNAFKNYDRITASLIWSNLLISGLEIMVFHVKA